MFSDAHAAAGPEARVSACGTGMAAHWGNGVEDAARLEAALERIALARQTARSTENASAEAGSVDHAATREAARRLDSLIADIRALLGKDTAD
jgi:hypothetical protein